VYSCSRRVKCISELGIMTLYQVFMFMCVSVCIFWSLWEEWKRRLAMKVDTKDVRAKINLETQWGFCCENEFFSV
jgi:hypothetical protein